jgi:hypothetical protein
MLNETQKRVAQATFEAQLNVVELWAGVKIQDL